MVSIDDDRDDRTTDSTTDDLVDALNDPDRRFVLHAVHDATTPVRIDDLVTRVVAFQNDSLPGDGVTTRDVRTRLHHVHLPKLGAVGLIEYDASAQVVAQSSTGNDIVGPIETMDQLTRSFDAFDGGQNV